MSTLNDFSSPMTQFSFDVNKSQLFKKDQQNFINVLGVNELNSLKNMSMLDTYLSKGNIVEPHYHQNAAELVYCISGCATVSIFNPFMKQLMQFTINPGQVVNVPQGWWHYEVATTDETHLLAIFDAPTPEVILGSDLLKFTPANIMAHTYCIDEESWMKVTHSVQPSTYIGPYKDCQQNKKKTRQSSPIIHPFAHQQPEHRF